MSPRSKKEYLETIFLCYKRSSREEKTAILDELCSNRVWHRKQAMRILRKFKRFRKP